MTRLVRGVSIYKPSSRSRKTDPYLMAFTPPGEKRQSKTGSTDLRLTIQAATRLGLHLEAIKLGIEDPTALRYAKAEAKKLDEHLKDFGKMLAAKGNTAGYARETESLARRVFTAAGIDRISGLVSSDVQVAIAGLPRERKAGKWKTPSLRTRDKAVTACKEFSKWLKRDRRAPFHLLEDLSHYNPAEDPRRVRRIVNAVQFQALVDVADAGPARGGMSGADRAMLYRLAMGTGIRFAGLMSLTPSSFHLAGAAPFVVVEARSNKNRTRQEQPIRLDLAALLKAWLKGKAKGEPVFSLTSGAKMMDAFRADLQAAGIPYELDGKVFDFHAQRNSFITSIVRQAGLAVAQDLAGHSTPLLTKRYTRLEQDDYRKALEGLPAAHRKTE